MEKSSLIEEEFRFQKKYANIKWMWINFICIRVQTELKKKSINSFKFLNYLDYNYEFRYLK